MAVTQDIAPMEITMDIVTGMGSTITQVTDIMDVTVRVSVGVKRIN